MRVLMLGWEFPPLITGGLGTACAGLTRALVDQGVEIDFVLPRPVESRLVDGVRVLSPGARSSRPPPKASRQHKPLTRSWASLASPPLRRDHTRRLDPLLQPLPNFSTRSPVCRN